MAPLETSLLCVLLYKQVKTRLCRLAHVHKCIFYTIQITVIIFIVKIVFFFFLILGLTDPCDIVMFWSLVLIIFLFLNLF